MIDRNQSLPQQAARFGQFNDLKVVPFGDQFAAVDDAPPTYRRQHENAVVFGHHRVERIIEKEMTDRHVRIDEYDRLLSARWKGMHIGLHSSPQIV
ncbi:MAG: hypothetical protein O9320_18400 [Magnetospirillum sp.]|nr:hypothetical protein [Magnetospirillum sp.]